MYRIQGEEGVDEVDGHKRRSRETPCFVAKVWSVKSCGQVWVHITLAEPKTETDGARESEYIPNELLRYIASRELIYGRRTGASGPDQSGMEEH